MIKYGCLQLYLSSLIYDFPKFDLWSLPGEQAAEDEIGQGEGRSLRGNRRDSQCFSPLIQRSTFLFAHFTRQFIQSFESHPDRISPHSHPLCSPSSQFVVVVLLSRIQSLLPYTVVLLANYRSSNYARKWGWNKNVLPIGGWGSVCTNDQSCECCFFFRRGFLRRWKGGTYCIRGR